MNLIVEICNNQQNGKCEIVVKDHGEINPDDAAPSLAVVHSKVAAMAMRWGFRSAHNQQLIINARSETAQDRSTFKNLVNNWRCALPAAGYFEWRDDDHLRHLISRSDGRAIYLAGLYRYDDTGVPRFVVLTREAYSDHAEIHDRMPCLLYSREEARQWISGTLTLEELYARKDDDLIITAQEGEQLRMTFDD